MPITPRNGRTATVAVLVATGRAVRVEVPRVYDTAVLDAVPRVERARPASADRRPPAGRHHLVDADLPPASRVRSRTESQGRSSGPGRAPVKSSRAACARPARVRTT